MQAQHLSQAAAVNRDFERSRPLPIFFDFGQGLGERDGVIRVGLGGVIGFERFQFLQFLEQGGVLVHIQQHGDPLAVLIRHKPFMSWPVRIPPPFSADYDQAAWQGM